MKRDILMIAAEKSKDEGEAREASTVKFKETLFLRVKQVSASLNFVP